MRSNVVANFTVSTMASCTACGSNLATIEYQARSADEATRTTTTCPNCPIDASRISTVYVTRDHPRGFNGPTRLTRTLSTTHDIVPVRRICRIHVDASTTVQGVNVQTKHITSPISAYRSKSLGDVDDMKNRIHYQVTGMLQGYCESVVATTRLGFGAYMEVVQVYKPQGNEAFGIKVSQGKFGIISSDNSNTTYMYASSVTNKNVVIVQYDTVVDLPVAAKKVCELYATVCVPKHLSNYIERRFVKELANLCPRAWDVPAPPTKGYKFTSKPDGERMWLVSYGLFWYACETERDRPIIKWMYNGNSAYPVQRPVVCDTEYTIERGFIFIDSLTEVNGKQVPVIRDIDYAIDVFHQLKGINSIVPITLRQYFDSNDDAIKYSFTAPYPTDGTLGIRDGSTETVKIKDTKAVELLLSPDGSLLTSDGDTVAVISDYDPSYVGKIVEVRLTASANDTYISVSDIFPRTNKTSPNSTQAVENILQSCVQFQSATDAERTMILKWCNTLCKSIVDRALSCNDTKHIVLDIGTGSGQSLDRFSFTESVSFIYVEPDERRAMSTARRARAKLIKDPLELGSMLRSLKTRRLQQVVLNCTLADVLSNEELSDVLMAEIKCVTCTFSAQFVVEQLRVLRDKYNCKIFGCMYTYDDVVNNVLVDSCGAVMKLIDEVTASVKWGNEEYQEPATYDYDYYGLGTIVRGSDILSLPTGADADNPADVCKHVKVIMS